MTWSNTAGLFGGIPVQVVASCAHEFGRVTTAGGAGRITGIQLFRSGIELRVKLTGPLGPFPAPLRVLGTDGSEVFGFEMFAPRDSNQQALSSIPSGAVLETCILIVLNDQDSEPEQPRMKLPGIIARELEGGD